MQPTTIYGICKVTGEMLGNYYHHKYGVDKMCIRDRAFAPDVESPYLVAPFVEHFARDGKNLREPLDEWLHMPYCGVDRYFHM